MRNSQITNADQQFHYKAETQWNAYLLQLGETYNFEPIESNLSVFKFNFTSFENERFNFLELVIGGNLQDFGKMMSVKNILSWQNKGMLLVSAKNLAALRKAVNCAHSMRQTIQLELWSNQSALETFCTKTVNLFNNSPKQIISPINYSDLYPRCPATIKSRSLIPAIQYWYNTVQIIGIIYAWYKLNFPFEKMQFSHWKLRWDPLVDEISQLIEPYKEIQSKNEIRDPIRKINKYYDIEYKGIRMKPFTEAQANVIKILHAQYMDPDAKNELKPKDIKRKYLTSYSTIKKVALKNADFWKVVKQIENNSYSLNID